MIDALHAVLVTAAPWLATYLVHSSALLLTAWAFDRGLVRSCDAMRECLWRTAMFGGLVTATLAVTGALPAPLTRWALAPTATVDAGPATSTTATSRSAPDLLERFALRSETAVPAPALPAAPRPTADAGTAIPGPAPHAAAVAGPLPTVGFWLTTTGVALGLGGAAGFWLLLRLAVLRARLGVRRPVRDGTLHAALEDLRIRAGLRRAPRLTTSMQLRSPCTFGIFRPEICVPLHALEALDDGALRAMLAHEIAHVRRRDPLLGTLALALQELACVQPLNRLARRRLQEIAEYRCDAWAARTTGDGAGLAHCLVEVATWLQRSRERQPAAVPTGALAMASRPSLLHHRVDRLLGSPAARPTALGLRATGVALLLLGGGTLPGIDWHAAPATSTEDVVVLEPAVDPEPTDVAEPAPDRALEAAIALLDEELVRLATDLDELHALVVEHPEAAADVAALLPTITTRLRALRAGRDELAARTAGTRVADPDRSPTPDQGDTR